MDEIISCIKIDSENAFYFLDSQHIVAIINIVGCVHRHSSFQNIWYTALRVVYLAQVSQAKLCNPTNFSFFLDSVLFAAKLSDVKFRFATYLHGVIILRKVSKDF